MQFVTCKIHVTDKVNGIAISDPCRSLITLNEHVFVRKKDVKDDAVKYFTDIGSWTLAQYLSENGGVIGKALSKDLRRKLATSSGTLDMNFIVDSTKTIKDGKDTTILGFLYVEILDNLDQIFFHYKHIGLTGFQFSQFALAHLLDEASNQKKFLKRQAVTFLRTASHIMDSKSAMAPNERQMIESSLSKLLTELFVEYVHLYEQSKCNSIMHRRLDDILSRKYLLQEHQQLKELYKAIVQVACQDLTVTTSYDSRSTHNVVGLPFTYDHGIFYVKRARDTYTRAIEAWRARRVKAANLKTETQKAQKLVEVTKRGIENTQKTLDHCRAELRDLPPMRTDVAVLQSKLDEHTTEYNIASSSVRIAENTGRHPSQEQRDYLAQVRADKEKAYAALNEAEKNLAVARAANFKREAIAQNARDLQDSIAQDQANLHHLTSEKARAESLAIQGPKIDEPKPLRPKLKDFSKAAQLALDVISLIPQVHYVAVQVLKPKHINLVSALVMSSTLGKAVSIAVANEAWIRGGSIVMASALFCTDPLIDKKTVAKFTALNLLSIGSESIYSCVISSLFHSLFVGAANSLIAGPNVGAVYGGIDLGINLLQCVSPDKLNVQLVPLLTLATVGTVSMSYGFSKVASLSNAIMANKVLMSVLSTDVIQNALPDLLLLTEEQQLGFVGEIAPRFEYSDAVSE